MRPIVWTVLDRARLTWALWRNRVIASPRLRDLARWCPPARLPARRYARSLFDLTAGFVYSQVTHAFVQSGLLAELAKGPVRLDHAVALAKLPPPAAETLLKAAQSLGLAERYAGLWVLGRQGAALASSPGVAEMIAHHHLLYADLADPLAMLRGAGAGRLARLWEYGAEADPEDVTAYSALMAASQPMVAAQATVAYPFSRHRGLLDVGGGTGAFLDQVRRAAPHLSLGLFDRAPVIREARQRLGSTVSYHAGSFHSDPLPDGYDLISLVRVLHDHDEEPARRLLAATRQSLAMDGRVLIVEPLAETRGAGPMGHAYFGFYLAAMRSGRPRSFAEYKHMLDRAGFRNVRRHRVPLPLIASVISGQK
jgi:demethylspheroidene O-methyltransferase